MRAQLKWIQTTWSCSRTMRHLTLPEISSATCRGRSHLYQAWDVASKQSRLEYDRLCSVGSPAIGDRWWVVRAVWKVHWLIVVSMKATYVVQQNGRHIEHLLKQLVSRRLYTAAVLRQFMHICELYSFIDLFASSTKIQAKTVSYTHLTLPTKRIV